MLPVVAAVAVVEIRVLLLLRIRLKFFPAREFGFEFDNLVAALHLELDSICDLVPAGNSSQMLKVVDGFAVVFDDDIVRSKSGPFGG